jgi:hypothetical protein
VSPIALKGVLGAGAIPARTSLSGLVRRSRLLVGPSERALENRSASSVTVIRQINHLETDAARGGVVSPPTE